MICGTRYGNVMASRGSVIPLFIQQIKAGQPLTVTDPDMTRFMMSIEDAVDLVLLRLRARRARATSSCRRPRPRRSRPGAGAEEVFDADIPVKVIGTRHGEKLYETLLTREEMAVAEDLGGYYRVPADNRDLNYDLTSSEGGGDVSRRERLQLATTPRRLSVDEMTEMLLELDIVQRARGGERLKLTAGRGPHEGPRHRGARLHRPEPGGGALETRGMEVLAFDVESGRRSDSQRPRWRVRTSSSTWPA